MKAHLRSARIAPKKANIIAKMVRGMPVLEAISALERTHKKAARLVEDLLRSAVANASHNDRQDARLLVIKTIVVNQGMGLPRGVPMARGRVRPMTKFYSHISVTLGIADDEKGEKAEKTPTKKVEKKTAATSQKPRAAAQSSGSKAPAKKSSASADSATPSAK